VAAEAAGVTMTAEDRWIPEHGFDGEEDSGWPDPTAALRKRTAATESNPLGDSVLASEGTLHIELAKPFRPDEVDWRVARELNANTLQVLAYIDARCVERRLDDVFGVAGWQTRVVGGMGAFAVGCELSVNWPGIGWITKSNVSDPTDVEGAKGGYSTAFKRAAAHGLGIGRYLYDLGENLVTVRISGGRYRHKMKSGAVLWVTWDPPAGVFNPDGTIAPRRDAGRVDVNPPPADPRLVITGAPGHGMDPPDPIDGPGPAADSKVMVPPCPKCGGAMWDNRADKRNPKSPDFKCRDRACGHPIWLNSGRRRD